MNKLFSNQGTLNLEDMILIHKKDALNVLKCILILPKAYKHQAFECFDTSKALRHIL